jgi:hypothetical protein
VLKRIKNKRKQKLSGTRKLRRDALGHARSLVGIMESGGNNRGKRVEQIIRANGGVPGEPWCGDFVAYCYRKAGSRAVTRSWAAVRYLGYLSGMRITRKPRAGHIVCYTFDHTGILDCLCNAHGTPVSSKRATHVKVIEGNTGSVGAVSDSKTGGDGVHTKVRPLSQVARFVKVLR